MRPLEELWTKSPLSEDIVALSDPRLRFDRDRSRVNELVVGAVVKYLAQYLKIASDDIGAIRDQVGVVLKRKHDLAFQMDDEEGMQFDACYGKLAPGNDETPVRCLADIQRTSALFKEIAFGGSFMDNGRFVGIDLGSGTGILTLAMAVAANRRRIKDFYCVGMERLGIAAKRSQETLSSVIGSDHVSVFSKDVRGNGVLSSLFRKPIHYWVSETISINTPKLDLRYRDFKLSEDQRLLRRLEQGLDPFVEALRVSLDELKLFKPYVQKGAIAMFPDLINGLYKPDGGRSTLSLRTALDPRPAILERVGAEFEGVGSLMDDWKRWYSPDEVEMLALRSDVSDDPIPNNG